MRERERDKRRERETQRERRRERDAERDRERQKMRVPTKLQSNGQPRAFETHLVVIAAANYARVSHR